jgi:hypothetical protein
MKLTPLNPLAMLGALHGMNRPLDRDDFSGGHVSRRAGEFLPTPGQLRSLSWGHGDYPSYEGVNSGIGILSGDDAAAQDTFNTNVVTTTQRHPLGTIAISKDGRLFRYASVGATDTVAGSIYQSAAPIANHLALTSAAQAIGDGYPTPIVVTPGATAGAANLYAEGYLGVDTTPSNGYTHRISGHPAITASTAFNLYLDPDERVQIAFTTATRYGLFHNPWKTVIVAATTVTASVCGAAPIIITGNGTSENYGWLQTRGHFQALINGTPGVGIGLVSSATTAGALDVAAVAAEINVRIIARARQVCVSGKNNAVFLMLD